MKAALLNGDEDVRSLLRDVLGDFGVELLTQGGQPTPDVVFAVVRPEDEGDLVDLRLAAGVGAPVIAVLPIVDERLRRRVLAAGALACCTLDAPLGDLRVALIRVISASHEDVAASGSR